MILGSGIDVIEIARVERALLRHGGPTGRFAERVFSAGERAACAGLRRPGPQLAMRFAMKEAVMKAVGTGWSRGVRWIDIEAVADPGAPPEALRLVLHGRIAEIARGRGARRFHVGVSRTRTHAVAVALLEGDAA
ncbi:MAG TPA: holo-ACP synthase [Myxococcota bacterium]|nr:holo-ACP synthase [Myxococcota bacterium]